MFAWYAGWRDVSHAPEPVLNAVLLPGQHITFARLIADRTYEALPSASVILRLTSKWPLNGERVRVTLVPVSPPGSGAQLVRRQQRSDLD